MREEQNNSRQLYIEFLKGLAIFTVLIFHIDLCYMPEPDHILTKLISQFFNTTRVFFFCSGFGLYYSYLRKPIEWKDFIKKRFLKVYLPYIIIVFICFLVPYTYEYDDRFSALLSHIFLYKMFIPKYIGSFGPFWFMSSIFQYYLLFYALIKMKNKVNNNRLFLSIWIVISLLWSILIWRLLLFNKNLDSVLSTFFFLHCAIFVLGMLCAEYLYQNKEFSLTVQQLVLICIAMLIPIFLLVGCDMYYLKEIPRDILIICLCTILWAICGNKIRRFIAWVGSFSFEWYLTHMLILDGLYRLFKLVGNSNKVLFSIIGFIITAFAAWLYHRFVQNVLFRRLRI